MRPPHGLPQPARPIYPGWQSHRPGWNDGRVWRRYRRPFAYAYPANWFAFSWLVGQQLPPGWYGGQYLLGDPGRFGLPYPAPGFGWARVADDVMLISLNDGTIYEVRRGWFY